MTTPTFTSGLSPGDLVLSHSTYLPLRAGTPLLVLEVEPGAQRLDGLGSPRLRVITPEGAPFTVEQHWVKLASRLDRSQEAGGGP
jgi:hypothetical protein